MNEVISNETVLSDIFKDQVSAEGYIKLARNFEKNKSQEEAIELLEEGAQNFPKHSKLWYKLGRRLITVERYDDAINALKKSIDLNSDNQKASNHLQKLESNLVYSDILKQKVTPQKYTKEAKQLGLQGNRNKQIELLGEATENFSQDHILWCSLGISLSFADKHQEAQTCFDEALKIKPNDPTTLRAQRMAHKRAPNIDDRFGWDYLRA